MKETVLIVDDETNIRESLAKALRRSGYETFTAANGAEAEAIYREHRSDIVLLDLNMPVKNGWETFEIISTLDPLTPIVLITGRPDQFELAAAARVGALMEKPLNVPVLLQMVRRLVDEPLSLRLSRLAFRDPGTAFHGSDPHGGMARDPASLVALSRMRKNQLAELRARGSTDDPRSDLTSRGEGH